MTYTDYMEMWTFNYMNGKKNSREVPITEAEWNKRFPNRKEQK